MKSYLRYVQDSVFGVISSTQNLIYDHSGKYAVSPALEHVLIWDIKRGSLIAQWHDPSCKSQVTFITKNNSGNVFAIGYWYLDLCMLGITMVQFDYGTLRLILVQ
jgi:U3 small nucleolar RNA-associated protein 12